MSAVFLPVPYLWSQVFTDAGVVGSGYQVNIYQAGTTVRITTYTDSTLTSQNPNPIIASGNGRLVNASGGGIETWINSGTLAKIILTDATGNPISGGTFDNISGINDVTLTAATIGAALYPVTPQEGATVVNIGWPYGYITRYGGNGDNGVTDNTTPFQSALNSGYPVMFPSSANGYYKMSGRVFANNANTSINLASGVVVKWTSTTAASGANWLGSPTIGGLQVNADNFTLSGRGQWVGPSVGIFVGSPNPEMGLLRIGAGQSNRGNGFNVYDVEFYNWGYAAIATQFVQNMNVARALIHNCGYVGIGCLSNLHTRIRDCIVHDITPGTSGNMYCIAITHDSTNYSSDPNAVISPRQTVNPFCIDTVVEGCTVYNSQWEGIDAHGAYECDFINNKVYNCFIGCQISSSSGAAINYAGGNNRIEGNEIYGPQINGNNTTVTAGYQIGITVNGGSTVAHTNVTVANNTLFGMGQAGGTGPGIQASGYVNGFTISGNKFVGCLGRGIYLSTVTWGVISDNTFNGVGASNVGSACIYVDSNVGVLNIHGNIHSPTDASGTPYIYGVNGPGSGYSRMIIGQNDFDACSGAAYVNLSQAFLKGTSDKNPQVADTTTGSHTVALAALAQTPVIYYSYGGAGVATITDFTGGGNGQLLMVSNNTGSNLTINNTGGHIRLPSGTQTLGQYGAAQFVSVGGVWYSLAVPGTNT